MDSLVSAPVAGSMRASVASAQRAKRVWSMHGQRTKEMRVCKRGHGRSRQAFNSFGGSG